MFLNNDDDDDDDNGIRVGQIRFGGGFAVY
jgi:hypothetical protein